MNNIIIDNNLVSLSQYRHLKEVRVMPLKMAHKRKIDINQFPVFTLGDRAKDNKLIMKLLNGEIMFEELTYMYIGFEELTHMYIRFQDYT